MASEGAPCFLIASHNPSTSLANRRALPSALTAATLSRTEGGHALSTSITFKRINDPFGHPHGRSNHVVAQRSERRLDLPVC